MKYKLSCENWFTNWNNHSRINDIFLLFMNGLNELFLSSEFWVLTLWHFQCEIKLDCECNLSSVLTLMTKPQLYMWKWYFLYKKCPLCFRNVLVVVLVSTVTYSDGAALEQNAREASVSPQDLPHQPLPTVPTLLKGSAHGGPTNIREQAITPQDIIRWRHFQRWPDNMLYYCHRLQCK